MPFGQSAIVAVVAAELSGYLMKHHTKMTPKQINFCKAVIAFIAGEATALPTVDALGGALTIPIALAYLLRALEVPKELASIIGMLVGDLTGADPGATLDGIDQAMSAIDTALA